MVRLWQWVWKRPHPSGPMCMVCHNTPMVLCPACEGDWRTTGCSVCLLGWMCPTHRNHWLP